MPIRQAALRALACLALFIAAGAAHATSTSVTLTSPAGEPLLGGIGTRVYTAPAATIETHTLPNGFSVLVGEGSDSIAIYILMPGVEPVREGSYLLAEKASTRTGLAPGIEVLTHNGQCADNRAWGSYKIRQYEEGGSFIGSPVARLEATFVYRCESSTAPALTGTVLIDAGPRSFSYTRGAGFPVGTKASGSFREDNGDIVLDEGIGRLDIGVSGQREDWTITFVPPEDVFFFEKGTYALSDANSADHAGMYITDKAGNACNVLDGTLNIIKITHDEDHALTGLYATWAITCEGEPAVFRGTLRYNL